MKIKVTSNAEVVKAAMQKAENQVRLARSVAASGVADKIKKDGERDIKSAGRFGSRWTTSWTARVTPKGIPELEEPIVIETFFDSATFGATPSYGHIFEFGGVIKPKLPQKSSPPLLWIPMSPDSEGILARDFGPLFRVTSKKGTPLLMSTLDGRPKYFGKESVTMPRKFRLREIGLAAKSNYSNYYHNAMRQING